MDRKKSNKMEEIKEIKSFLEHIQPTVGKYAFNEIWQTVKTLEEKLDSKKNINE